MKTIETKKKYEPSVIWKDEPRPCAWNTLSKTVSKYLGNCERGSELMFLSQTSFTTGQMCVYKQACLRIIACVCVCMRLQRWSSYDYFGCWSRFRLEGQYVSSPGLAATPDQMAWERKREHLVLWKLWKQHRSSYINFQHWKCDSWKWENISVIQSQMGESLKKHGPGHISLQNQKKLKTIFRTI